MPQQCPDIYKLADTDLRFRDQDKLHTMHRATGQETTPPPLIAGLLPGQCAPS